MQHKIKNEELTVVERVAFQGEYVAGGRGGGGAVTYILRVCTMSPSGDFLLFL